MHCKRRVESQCIMSSRIAWKTHMRLHWPPSQNVDETAS